MLRAQRAELGDRHLLLGENLEEERFELRIGAIDLVDEKHDRLVAGERLQNGTRDEKAHAEERIARPRECQPVACFGECARAGGVCGDALAEKLRVEHLLGVVPLVKRFGLVEAFVALQANELSPERIGQRARQIGLADSGGALEQERASELDREPRDEGRLRVGEIADTRERAFELLVAGRERHDFGVLI